jgi:hypothetical protein
VVTQIKAAIGCGQPAAPSGELHRYVFFNSVPCTCQSGVFEISDFVNGFLNFVFRKFFPTLLSTIRLEEQIKARPFWGGQVHQLHD